ncbi:bifunctional glutamate--cysteine ligase GshA/glutathione synthetase GshB [Enterococcus sp. LJL98]
MASDSQSMQQEPSKNDFFSTIRCQLEINGLLVDENQKEKRVTQKEKQLFPTDHPMIDLRVQTAQVKIKTVPFHTIEEAFAYLSALQHTLMKQLGPDFYLDPQWGTYRVTFSWPPFLPALEEESTTQRFSKVTQRLNQLFQQLQPLLPQTIQARLVDEKAGMGIQISGLLMDSTSKTGLSEPVVRLLRLLLWGSLSEKEHAQISLESLLESLSAMGKYCRLEAKDQQLLAQLADKGNWALPRSSRCRERMLKQHQSWWENPFELQGYETMELSTQLMLSEALQRGIAFEVIDRQDQLVKLSHGGHIEYVKNTNMTSKDTYIAPLIMENKTATKEILRQQGFHVPYGKEFSSFAEALAAYETFAKMAVVVKPKTTNFGLGISIFQASFLKEDYQEALRLAFAEDDFVLVETFMPGTEYRFYVLDGQVEGVVLRVAANVTGDGLQTIEALVEQKNQDPLRGTGYRRPLQKIQLGDIETLMLKTQGYRVTDVLEKGKTVYLRENSNVSTGGDSIDQTDEMHPSYKQIAQEAVLALGAFVSGVDLMIPDLRKPAHRLSEDYGIIEANFNPAIHMHMYPYQGKGRPLAGRMLDKLFPATKSTTVDTPSLKL